ncbi:hypothetical protein OAS69_06445 [Pseudomonadales bacterium]|nr:hypothetical protein [Pseudomonadales bacterium]
MPGSQLFIEPGANDFRDVIQLMIASEEPRKIREFVINVVEEAHRDNAD